jgi:two-component system, cell cycle sensor histidine kinase and response regulator CckA
MIPRHESPPRVLVVDEQRAIHEIAREVLRPAVIVSAMTMAEARLIAAREELDAALVDKDLPDGSGIDLVRWLRGAWPDVGIVMSTARPSMDWALEAMSLGAMDYLIKPIRDRNELRLRVGNACERSRQRRSERVLVAALRDSEERYRQLFEASPDAVLVLDSATREIVDLNPAATRLYGRGRASLIGCPSGLLTADEPPPMVNDGVISRRELQADGGSAMVEVSTGVAVGDGRSYIIEVIRDVSERQRSAAERAELHRRLSRAGRLEALGRMAAGIAHDVNNMLCVIRTYNSLAVDAIDAAHPAHPDLEQVEVAVANASDLTRSLLAFSGRQLVRDQVLDLNVIVESVGRLIGRSMEARTRLELDLSPAPLHVKMDPGQLEQVIANLLVNARDAMPQGGQVTMMTSLVTDEPRVSLRVRDTGVGIAPEILHEIFEPFFSTKGTQGTGLGLATVREIVTRVGGRIDVKSCVGEGTQFEIRLPLSDEDPHAITDVLAHPIGAGRGESLLLVEDDAAVRTATSRLLGRSGYAVYEAASAEAALAIIAAHPIRLVIADLDLPGKSGLDLAKELSDRMRVVFTSGMASDAAALDGRTFLPKPYNGNDLLRYVRRALDRR